MMRLMTASKLGLSFALVLGTAALAAAGEPGGAAAPKANNQPFGPPPPPGSTVVPGLVVDETGEPVDGAVEDEDEVAKTARGVIEFLSETVRFYGSLRVNLVANDGDQEVANGASRVGFDFRKDYDELPSLIGKVEWFVNLADDNTVVSVGDSTSDELNEEPGTSVFETRLGWLGVDLHEWGRVQLGKQWGPYYAVTGWTDQFPVFGAAASSTFNAGTDGGATGTGRASQAIGWRNEFGAVDLAAQVQLAGLSDDNNETFGTSVVWHATDTLSVGVAFNFADLDNDVANAAGVDDEAWALSAGARYVNGPWHAALVYAYEEQHEIADLGNNMREGYDANGVELYVRRAINERYGIFGGTNWLEPEDSSKYDDDFGLRDFYLGGDLVFDENSKLFTQYKLAEGHDENGRSDDNAFVVGIYFGW